MNSKVYSCDVCGDKADVIMWHGQNGRADVWYCHDCVNDFYYAIDGEEQEDDFESALSMCSMGADGFCGQAGSEYCDWECPIMQNGRA